MPTQDHSPAPSSGKEGVGLLPTLPTDTEWPIEAYWSKDAAEDAVTRFSERARAARAEVGSSPAWDATEEDWEAFHARQDAALASVKDVGGSDLDMTFFTYAVPLAGSAEGVATVAEGESSRPSEGAGE